MGRSMSKLSFEKHDYVLFFLMVSNLGIEKNNEMSKLRPPVDLLGGFFNILQYVQTST